jgi:hypothetical protein
MTRRRKVAIVAVYAVTIGFGVALFSGNLPGLGGTVSADYGLGGHEYYPDYYSIPTPTWGSNSTTPSSVLFHNVTFWVWVTNWGRAYGALVHGNGTEQNGTTYGFVLGGYEPDHTGTELFVSPDSKLAAIWDGSFILILLVEVAPVNGTTALPT